MFNLARKLFNDESGYIMSAELVLIGTIVTLSLVVGLSEISFAVNNELHDVANAYNALSEDSDSRYLEPLGDSYAEAEY